MKEKKRKSRTKNEEKTKFTSSRGAFSLQSQFRLFEQNNDIYFVKVVCIEIALS